ncbi:MAG: hypothetical protein IT440_02965 [Phycisphaeraceae bacterium]|nr:hypothetical protein [Phycisphaeraceae bacterium]
MSILTKIFVVLVTFLSVALVALIVPFVAKTENYKAQLSGAEEMRIRAEATARLRQAEINALQDRESERVRSLRSEIAALTSQISSLTQDLETERSRLAAAKADNAKFDANINRLTASHQQFASILEATQAELKERRNEAVTLQTRIITLTDTNDDLTGQLDSTVRQVRKFQEQMTQLQDRSKELESMIDRLDPAIRAQIMRKDDAAAISQPFSSATRITGTVDDIQQFESDTLVQVNVGKNDGVEANMKFIIHRGGQYLGSMVITRVDANASAGRMTLMSHPIVKGDQVQSGGL